MNRLNLDKIGVCASALCALHCAVTPVLFVLVGSLGALSFLENEFLETLLIGTTLVIGCISIGIAYIKHRKHHIAWLFVSGLLLLLGAEMATLLWVSVSSSIIGGLLIACAHVQNLKFKAQKT